MAKKTSITNEARAKVMLALKACQQENPDGCTLTTLNRKLNWRKRETSRAVNDLEQSGMVYGDYLSHWASSHFNPHKLTAHMGYLLKVSPWGDQFLEHWSAITELATARDHHYSEIEYDIEREIIAKYGSIEAYMVLVREEELRKNPPKKRSQSERT